MGKIVGAQVRKDDPNFINEVLVLILQRNSFANGAKRVKHPLPSQGPGKNI